MLKVQDDAFKIFRWTDSFRGYFTTAFYTLIQQWPTYHFCPASHKHNQTGTSQSVNPNKSLRCKSAANAIDTKKRNRSTSGIIWFISGSFSPRKYRGIASDVRVEEIFGRTWTLSEEVWVPADLALWEIGRYSPQECCGGYG